MSAYLVQNYGKAIHTNLIKRILKAVPEKSQLFKQAGAELVSPLDLHLCSSWVGTGLQSWRVNYIHACINEFIAATCTQQK